MEAFLSYSHKDAWALERLHTHLSMLRREGKIADWFDRDILAGGEIDGEIMARLERVEIFIPLVSPDFLDSKYCYENEMERALERHEEGTMRVVPIIVEPCDWHSSPLQRFKALPRDGRPISEWTNKNNAFLDIVTELRRLIDENITSHGVTASDVLIRRPVQSRKYRVKKEFDEIDRGDFRRSAFQIIRDYFRGSIDEINKIEGIRSRFQDLSAQGFTCTVANHAIRRGVANLTVYMGSRGSGLGDIYYSFRENAEPNTANGTFDIGSDDFELFLTNHMKHMHGDNKKLSPQDAAESLWVEFIEQAGISCD